MFIDEQSQTIADLRRSMRDLAAIASLPAIFANADAETVCSSLCDVLIRCLPVDFAFLRVGDYRGDSTRQVLRTSDGVDRAAVESVVADHLDAVPGFGAVIERGEWRIACAKLGPYAASGILIAGARARDFPNEGERLLLNVAANQTGIMLALKESELETLKLCETLEARVEERTAHVLEINEQLRSFTYSVAHDLRQYIRGINVNAKGIIADAGPSFDETVIERLDNLAYSAVQLGGLVDDLLTSARIARYQLLSDSVDVSALAAEVCGVIVESDTYPPGIKFDIAPSMQAVADPAMLRVLLENLIDNACKFSRRRGSRVVAVGRESDAFYVRDNGIGFDMVYAHKVFLPLERLQGGKTPRGTGMGLAIARRIVERHDGKIWVESRPNEGSTFYFTLGAALPQL